MLIGLTLTNEIGALDFFLELLVPNCLAMFIILYTSTIGMNICQAFFHRSGVSKDMKDNLFITDIMSTFVAACLFTPWYSIIRR